MFLLPSCQVYGLRKIAPLNRFLFSFILLLQLFTAVSLTHMNLKPQVLAHIVPGQVHSHNLQSKTGDTYHQSLQLVVPESKKKKNPAWTQTVNQVKLTLKC